MGRPSKIAVKNIREAIELHIASLAKRSTEIPQAEKLVHVEEISIGLRDN
jgi:predicted RNase H-like HicB family nuclease